MDVVRRHTAIALLLVAATLSGCRGITNRQSPHEDYAATLRNAGLDETALAQDWLRTATASLHHPVKVQTPFSETTYVAAEEPTAVAYELDLRRGRRLVVELSTDSSRPARVFVDLFSFSSNDVPERVAFLEAERSVLEYEVEQDGRYVLRVQAELLRGVRFTIVQRTVASLPFPIPGKTTSTVQSSFGATRAEGTRRHEGVDIFVPQGTIVTAVTDGIARPSRNNLGGNVVWLTDWRHGRTFYYAHLDGWAIDGLTRVRAGDPLGYVGNTGNARSTPPHLHFGLYHRGAIDPLPFLQADERVPSPAVAIAIPLGALVRTNASRAQLRDGPSRESPARRPLDRNTVARLDGIAATWARVSLPDETSGYLPVESVSSASVPLRRIAVLRETTLHERAAHASPVVAVLVERDSAELLGQFGEYVLLKPASGRAGWTARR